MVWKADHVQGVIFPVPGSKQSSALELWREIFPHTEPDAYHGAGPSPIGATQANGNIENFQIGISAQIGRIDIAISPTQSDLNQNLPPQIENISLPLKKIENISANIIKMCRVARVATVAQLSVHFDNAQNITSFINESAGTNFPLESTDNIYQLNVRKPYLLSPELLMNRVCTWNSGIKQMISAQIDLNVSNFGLSSAIIIPVAALKLDMNSATNHDITDFAISMISEQCREIELILSRKTGLIDG